MPDYVWIQNVIFPLIGMGGVGLLCFGAYRIVNRVLDRKLAAGPDAEHLEALRAEIDELRRDHTHEITDLHERIDFAERLLARAPEHPRQRETTPV